MTRMTKALMPFFVLGPFCFLLAPILGYPILLLSLSCKSFVCAKKAAGAAVTRLG